MKKVLVIGGGGREDALSWKLKQSPKVSEVIRIGVLPNEEIVSFAKENKIDFAVVGPDDALAAGVADSLEQAGIVAFGASQKAAQIESSKAFAKMVMQKYGVPTAAFKTCNSYEEASDYIQDHSLPIVVKASGLALGKGVYICNTKEEAEDALKEIMLDKKFGASGNEVVIEEFMQGRELSIHAFCDGKTSVMFPASQDHKTIFENNKGPNTGGMGTIAPLPWVTKEHLEKINKEIVQPLLAGMEKEGAPFKGLLYPGLMEHNGEFKVVEFNSRFGDPETQSYMRLLDSDLYDVLYACATGTLDQVEIKWSDKSAACVVLASGGYPGSYEKGFEIIGIEEAEKDTDVVVFHAGIKKDGDKILTNGGRVLNVTATGDDLEEALRKIYLAIEKICFEGMQYRRDIGKYSLGVH